MLKRNYLFIFISSFIVESLSFILKLKRFLISVFGTWSSGISYWKILIFLIFTRVYEKQKVLFVVFTLDSWGNFPSKSSTLVPVTVFKCSPAL